MHLENLNCTELLNSYLDFIDSEDPDSPMPSKTFIRNYLTLTDHDEVDIIWRVIFNMLNTGVKLGWFIKCETPDGYVYHRRSRENPLLKFLS